MFNKKNEVEVSSFSIANLPSMKHLEMYLKKTKTYFILPKF